MGTPRAFDKFLEALEPRLLFSSNVAITATASGSGTISGVAFEDMNGTGQLSSGDPRPAGVDVFLDPNHTAIAEPTDRTTTTNSRGQFAFSGLSPGTYHVTEELNPGVTQTFLVPTGAALSGLKSVAFTPAPQNPLLPEVGTAGTVTLSPFNIAAAYQTDVTFNDLTQTTANGAGQTIAIIDPGNNPNITSDLAVFDNEFNLPPPPSFTVMEEQGTQDDTPATGRSRAVEEDIDVEWAHAIAPGAKILLIETSMSAAHAYRDQYILRAVDYARRHAGVSVISMSFTLGNIGNDLPEPLADYEYLFTTPAGHRGITFLASSGDSGASQNLQSDYPAQFPTVVAVGGTTLNFDDQNPVETGWSGSGGGYGSQIKPPYQTTALGTSYVSDPQDLRTFPDVSAAAVGENGPTGTAGYAVYDSWDAPARSSGAAWIGAIGTSVATPLWAGIIALADQGRAAVGEGFLDGATQTLPALYQLPSSDFHDITTGNNGYAAAAGYDLVTGLGTPDANLVVNGLISYQSQQSLLEYKIVLTSSDLTSNSVDFPNVLFDGAQFPSLTDDLFLLDSESTLLR